MKTLPIYQHMSAVAIVDDDPFFIEAAKMFLGKRRIVKPFLSPQALLKYTAAVAKKNTSPLKALKNDELYVYSDRSPVDFDITSILEIMHDVTRIDEVSVLVTDFKMNDLNGIDLCRKLKNNPMKKILLTGEADLEQAVQAFNEGLIDRFVRKDDPNMSQEIQEHIDELNAQYFIDQTQGLLCHLEADGPLPLSDIEFSNFFRSWCKDNKVVEYFLIDKSGSFLTVDESDYLRNFVVHTEKTLSSFIDLCDETENAQLYTNAVLDKSAIPFFGVGKAAWEFDVEEWKKYFFPASVISGRDSYYYSVVESVG